MSNRSWTCLSCGWVGMTLDAAHTAAGARRCPACKSGALVITDPGAEARNAAGAAKRINRARDEKAPLLAYAGLIPHTDAEEVARRRDEADVHTAVHWQEMERSRAAEEVRALEVRASLAPLIPPEQLAQLDARRAGLPKPYGLSFWNDTKRKHESGELAAEAAETIAATARAEAYRAELVAIAVPELMAELQKFFVEVLHSPAGDGAEIYWRERLRDARGDRYTYQKSAAP